MCFYCEFLRSMIQPPTELVVGEVVTLVDGVWTETICQPNMNLTWEWVPWVGGLISSLVWLALLIAFFTMTTNSSTCQMPMPHHLSWLKSGKKSQIKSDPNFPVPIRKSFPFSFCGHGHWKKRRSLWKTLLSFLSAEICISLKFAVFGKNGYFFLVRSWTREERSFIYGAISLYFRRDSSRPNEWRALIALRELVYEGSLL